MTGVALASRGRPRWCRVRSHQNDASISGTLRIQYSALAPSRDNADSPTTPRVTIVSYSRLYAVRTAAIRTGRQHDRRRPQPIDFNNDADDRDNDDALFDLLTMLRSDGPDGQAPAAVFFSRHDIDESRARPWSLCSFSSPR
jgi:hypothetical protein